MYLEFKKNNFFYGWIVRLNVSEFWKEVETQSASSEPAVEVESGQASQASRDKKKSKAEQWELSLSDDSWYRAPQFSPMGTQSRRTDIEVLCEIIYGYGERYDDGTAAIGFTWLFKVNFVVNFVALTFNNRRCSTELILSEY